MNFRAYHSAVAEQRDEPPACSYCGSAEFEPEQDDNGRIVRSTCVSCGGTMISHGGTWMPDLIGSPHNHPSDKPDSASGGVGGAGSAPVVLRTNDLSARTAGANGELPEGLTAQLRHYQPGDDEHNDLDSHRPGWSHRLLSVHLPEHRDEVGRMEFSVGPDTVRIHETRVHQDYRRRGVASAMDRTVRAMHPEHEFDRGTATADGEAWRQRTAGVDWCRHRHAEHCWLPRNDSAHPEVALYTPQDRGVCPWTMATMQQINCPMSEPGPMAGMTRAAARGDDVGPLLPVKHAGFKGFVEAYEGHEHNMREMDHAFDGDSHHGFDEDTWDHSAPDPNTHERAHHHQHDEYPDSYHERHDEAYGEAIQQHQEDESPVGHHTSLINFVHSHGDDHHFWGQHAQLQDVDHSKQSVYATQPYVVQHHLDRYAANRNDTVHHVKEFGLNERAAQYPGTHHPMMVHHEGNMYAIEGHHRTASDIMGGRKTRALVFDADKHGFPVADGDGYDVEHHGLRKYAMNHAHECDYKHRNPKKAAQHALYNHDDGICAATELKRAQKRTKKTGAFEEPEWLFHVLATWHDVRNKAKRIRTEGGVSILVASDEGITGHVQGDTAIYESQITYVPGSRKIGYWNCGCAWASYAWGRSPIFRRFEGRLCSHSYALQLEAQSRGMFGRSPSEDTQRPSWMRQHTPVQIRHDRDEGSGLTRRTVPPANMRRTFEGSTESDPWDVDGTYPVNHGLDLQRSPLHAFAVVAYAQRGDPADVLRLFLAAGIEPVDARRLLDATLNDHAAINVQVRAAKDERPDEPTHAGVALKAQDTGRVLMIQRSHKDEDDPAAGRWEFPGGGREEGDHHSLHSGIREFEEEVGQPFPLGGHVQHVWQSPNGVYQGHVVMVPSEDCLDFSNGRRTTNPDDPDGDDHEQSAWWHPDDARKNPALREELRDGPWKHIKAASLQHTAILPEKPQTQTCPSCGRVMATGLAACPDCGQHQEPRGTEHHQGATQRTADYAAHDFLEDAGIDWRPKSPPKPPDADQPENPGSTGWATGQDPPEWGNAAERAETMSLSTGTVAELHDPAEPALPQTTGETDDEELVESPGERFRSQMRSEIGDIDQSALPNSVHASGGQSVSDIVARFQTTAAASHLRANGGTSDMDIAGAARAHLTQAPGIQRTALRDFSAVERAELIGEGRGTAARNLTDLDIKDTHYAALVEALAHEQTLAESELLFD